MSKDLSLPHLSPEQEFAEYQAQRCPFHALAPHRLAQIPAIISARVRYWLTSPAVIDQYGREAQKSISKFVGEVPPTAYEEALVNAMRSSHSPYNQTMTRAIDRRMNVQYLGSLPPSWADNEAVVREFFKASSPFFWYQLVHEQQLSHPETVREMSVEICRVDGKPPTFEDTANSLAEKNAVFYGVVTASVATAALVGAELDFDRASRSLDQLHALDSLKKIAAHYPKPAADFDTFLSRMQELFPAATNRQLSEKPALAYLKENNYAAFRSRKNPKTTCPAIGATAIIYTAIGNLLQRPDYQLLLQSRISK